MSRGRNIASAANVQVDVPHLLIIMSSPDEKPGPKFSIDGTDLVMVPLQIVGIAVTAVLLHWVGNLPLWLACILAIPVFSLCFGAVVHSWFGLLFGLIPAERASHQWSVVLNALSKAARLHSASSPTTSAPPAISRRSSRGGRRACRLCRLAGGTFRAPGRA